MDDMKEVEQNLYDAILFYLELMEKERNTDQIKRLKKIIEFQVETYTSCKLDNLRREK